MGAKIILSGLQDAVIETMVELGMTLPEVDAVLDLDDALELSRQLATEQQIEIEDGADDVTKQGKT